MGFFLDKALTFIGDVDRKTCLSVVMRGALRCILRPAALHPVEMGKKLLVG